MAPPKTSWMTGFTFVEVLIALSLFLVIMAGAFTLVISTSKEFKSIRGQRDMQHAARIGIDELSRTLQNVGYGIDRPDPYNVGKWQHDLVYAGSHALAFNADLDPTLGPIDASHTLTFPTGETYTGEGVPLTTSGAETYLYTLDANGGELIDLTDRTAGL